MGVDTESRVTSVPAPTDSTQSLFVRNATGLVRELSAFDSFNISISAVIAPIGFIFFIALCPYFWPNANLLVSCAIGIPGSICFALVYTYFTVIMPRSGGDYVWLSRTLSPFFGFVVNASLTYVYLTWWAMNFTVFVTVCMPALAYVLGIKSHWMTNPSHLETGAILTLAVVLYTLLMVRSAHAAARFMFVLFFLVWAGMLLFVAVLAFTSHQSFIHSWNAHAGTYSYNAIIARAKSLGFGYGGSKVGPTFLAVSEVLLVYCGFQWTGYWAGEIKDVKKSAFRAIMGGMIFVIASYTIFTAVVYKVYGVKFIGSLMFLGFGGGAAHTSLPFAPYVTQLFRFTPVGVALQVIVIAGFALSVIWGAPAGFVMATRNVFAWSFDRLAPEKLTEVSDRYHSPVAATLLVAVFIEILCLLNVFSNLGAWELSIIWILGGGFIVVSFAAAWLPWHKPELHAKAPDWARRRFIGVPVITWVAIVNIIFWGYASYASFATGLAGLQLRPIIDSAVVPLFACAYYFGMRLYRRSQRVNMSLMFQEVPPE